MLGHEWEGARLSLPHPRRDVGAFDRAVDGIRPRASLVGHGGKCRPRDGDRRPRRLPAGYDPTSATYGIWSWHLEEPLAAMAPPDWNWADFIGARIAHALFEYQGKLPPDLLGRMSAALGHAAMAIFRRNTTPAYTNIAVMGAGVALAAGELLDEPLLLGVRTATAPARRSSTRRGTAGSMNTTARPTPWSSCTSASVSST